jgi:hypothetical protein
VAGGTYIVGFQVLNETPGGSYSFSWSLPLLHQIVTGCTSTTDFCDLRVQGTIDGDLEVDVTPILNGVPQATVGATAIWSASCGGRLC